VSVRIEAQSLPGQALRGAAGDVATAVHAALGGDDASVRVVLPDGGGRLRVVAAVGPSPEREESAQRRRVFETGSGTAVGWGNGRTLAILPLKVLDETFGLLELVAPDRTVDERRDAIVAFVRHSGALFKVSQASSASPHAVLAMERSLALANRLNAATDAIDAMSAFADVSSAHLDVPVAVTRPDRAGAGWFLAAVAGLEPDRVSDLRAGLRARTAAPGSPEALRQLSSVFSAATGSDAECIGVGEAVALVDASGAADRLLRTAASMLEATLGRIARNAGSVRDVDVGMAWTAHELRGPLVDAKAALEYVLSSGDPRDGVDILRRTKAELDRLTDIVDPLLRVSLGHGDLQIEWTDLVQLTRQAITSASFDDGRRVALEGPDRLPVRADPVQLRSALGNVIRNALAYSPAPSPVEVALESHETSATAVIRDRGPGIPAAEREHLFNAFVRGSTTGNRKGSGLGLFIAHRVIEAHEGRMWFESGPSGTTFFVQLPRRTGRGGPQRLAS
jgi:signal transduction histidine kinase